MLFGHRFHHFHRHHRHRPKISLLFPFRGGDPGRERVFKWVLRYWKHQLPDAEIIIGQSRRRIFSKTEALNDAARRAHGRVLVIIDADAYMHGHVIERAADRILENLDDHLWYVPYRHLYRLNQVTTETVLASDPCNPLRLPSPPPLDMLDDRGHHSGYGHRYGAMIMMFPREALDLLGCLDERFEGWGGEDVALLRALDTLYGKHKTVHTDLFHLWHPKIGSTFLTRVWEGQQSHFSNNKLAMAYHRATRHPAQMRRLVDEGCEYRRQHPRD